MARSRGATSAMALAVLIAYLPSIAYIGHWDLTVTLPGSQGHWHVPLFSSGHDHGYGEHRHDHDHHNDHCHGEAATCTSVPLTTVSPVTYLRAMVELSTGAGTLRALTASTLSAPPSPAYVPEIPPPRKAA